MPRNSKFSLPNPLSGDRISVCTLFVWGWIIFSLFYIGGHAKLFMQNQVFVAGQRSIVVEIMERTQNCQAVPLIAGQTQINIANIDCFNENTDSTNNTSQESFDEELPNTEPLN